VQRLGDVIENKRKRISAIGILGCNLIAIDDYAIEWLDAKEFDLATLAKMVGIDIEHKAKARVTIEITEEPCELCGKPTTGVNLCEGCGKVICDECAKIDASGRYCPICADLKKTPMMPRPT
jgi:hypothetical protein